MQLPSLQTQIPPALQRRDPTGRVADSGTRSEAQEQLLSADFDRTLRKKHALATEQAEERLRGPAAETRAADRTEEGSSRADGGPEEASAGDAASDDGAGRCDCAHDQGPSEGDGSQAIGEPVRAGDVLVEIDRAASEPAVTIAALNLQLLHGGVVVRGVGPAGMAKKELTGDGASTDHRVDRSPGERDARKRPDTDLRTPAPSAGAESTARSPGEHRFDGADAGADHRASERTDRSTNAAEAPLDRAGPTSARTGDRTVASVVSVPVAVPFSATGAGGGTAGSTGESATRPTGAPAGVTGGSRLHPGSVASAERAGANAGSSERPGSAEPSRFAAQLARGLSAALAQARSSGSPSEVTLRLQPRALGPVRIQIAVDEVTGGVSAKFEVSSTDARRLVGESLGDLRGTLVDRGLEVDSLEVRVAERALVRSDPVGLISGTPNAEEAEAGSPEASRLNPEEDRAGTALVDFDGGSRQDADDQADQADWGRQGRPETMWRADDGLVESGSGDEAAAERLLGEVLDRGVYAIGTDEGGALRVMIDAVA